MVTPCCLNQESQKLIVVFAVGMKSPGDVSVGIAKGIMVMNMILLLGKEDVKKIKEVCDLFHAQKICVDNVWYNLPKKGAKDERK